MQAGYLSSYFEGVAAKRLSSVEIDLGTSNQHEFNGVQGLKRILGMERRTFSARFLYMGDTEDQVFSEDGFVTWYDARERHPARSEYRLYFPSNSITEAASEDDLIIFGNRPDDTIMVIIIQNGSTYENQLLWLFGLPETSSRFRVNEIEDRKDKKIDFAARFILEALGIDVESADESWLDRILERFGSEFPTTKQFSSFSRETISYASSLDDPDAVLISWLDQEEMLFRTLEKYIVSKRLEQGFSDVDDFVSYSLSVHNRRKSRIGYALENHLEQVFIDYKISYSRGANTENKAKPDFLFPGIMYYRDDSFPDTRLTMLGVKSTCKERWRQVLSESQRIKSKHLLTLEPGISENQTNEMQSHFLQLVVPSNLHQTYNEIQQEWLMNMANFIKMVNERQDAI